MGGFLIWVKFRMGGFLIGRIFGKGDSLLVVRVMKIDR